MLLTDDDLMPSGKFTGHPMKLIPANYLIWYSENVQQNYENQNIHDYIKENLEVLKHEINQSNRQ